MLTGGRFAGLTDSQDAGQSNDCSLAFLYNADLGRMAAHAQQLSAAVGAGRHVSASNTCPSPASIALKKARSAFNGWDLHISLTLLAFPFFSSMLFHCRQQLLLLCI